MMCLLPQQCDKEEFVGPNTLINKARSWSRRGRLCGRISLRHDDLCWPGPPEMNPAAHLRHLYFLNAGLPPTKNRILGLLKADQAAHIDEIVERLETEKSPSPAL